MANKPGEANFFPDVPQFPSMGTFQPVYGKFDLTTYIQGASDYEIMAFLVGKYNACLEAYGTVTKLSTETVQAAHQLQDWINTWFTNLDVQQELNNKIDIMVQDGSFETLLHQTFDAQINQQTTSAVTAWLVANVTPTGSAVVVDKSLSIDGAAADAKATGAADALRLNVGMPLNTAANQITDANASPDNTFIRFATTSLPNNIPNYVPINFFLITLNNSGYKYQAIFDTSMRLLCTRYYDNEWKEWFRNNDKINTFFYDITDSVVGQYLPDLNNANDNTIYKIQVTTGSYPLHMPTDENGSGYILTITTDSVIGTIKSQYIFDVSMKVRRYRILNNNTWGDWYYPSMPNVITIGPNQDYTKLSDGLNAATARGNTTVYVMDGVYDLFQEGVTSPGIYIGNNIHVIFSSNALVTANYGLNDASTQSNFSVLNALPSNFTIENMKVESANIRYVVHDECGGSSTPYTHKFINCNFKIDNSKNPVWDSAQCIGGGLGKSGYILIDGGEYESYNKANNSPVISYHNNIANNSLSSIFIKNIISDINTIRAGYYGDSTSVTPIRICGCKLKGTPYLVHEVESRDDPVNMKIDQWNNIIL